MARSIAQIQASIITAVNTDPVIGVAGTDPLTSSSDVAIWLAWTWIIATAMWVTENFFDAHKAEVQGIIATQQPHTLQWYATMAKLFQYGYSLPVDSDVYATIDTTVQIVSFSAAVEIGNTVRLKAAKLSAGVLAPLVTGELNAFNTYMQRIKDAGVRLQCTSGSADSFRVALNVFYDPLVLDATGARLDGTAATPVQDAINTFLDGLPFNGVFVLNSLIAALQAVSGVTIAEITYCAATYGSLPYTDIDYAYTPDAGYLLLDSGYFTANTTYSAYGIL